MLSRVASAWTDLVRASVQIPGREKVLVRPFGQLYGLGGRLVKGGHLVRGRVDPCGGIGVTSDWPRSPVLRKREAYPGDRKEIRRCHAVVLRENKQDVALDRCVEGQPYEASSYE